MGPWGVTYQTFFSQKFEFLLIKSSFLKIFLSKFDFKQFHGQRLALELVFYKNKNN